MERQKVANAVLVPIDWVIGKGLDSLEAVKLLGPMSNVLYKFLQQTLKLQFKLQNELGIEGVENVPTTGGVLLASNHQSWLDAQVLGAACPRKVHFIAKAEFRDWPLIRRLIQLGESVFIKRGGDNRALDTIADALKKGWAVAIYPEGTIPGEEEIPRRAIDPKTGLLVGHTGVIRLALKSGVPIVPVGVSGTGRALPPEVYPRLELLRLPATTPIRIRFGEPIKLDAYKEEELTRELLRELTDDVMKKISSLVDHQSNYAPINVPMKNPPRKKKTGVLILHGFTSHLNSVNGLVPMLEKAGIKYSMPILRGHGTRYQDLFGVTAKDWYVDAERALIDLWRDVDQVVVVGFSMGGLVTLELAMRHPGKIAGIVSVATCLKFQDPLARFARRFAQVAKYWDNPPAFNDPDLGAECKNYPKFATDSFASLYEYSREIADRLGEVHVPIRILQSKADQIVAPVAANIIHEKVSSPRREIFWYQKSGHEMMQDLEAKQVLADVMEFVNLFTAENQHHRQPV